MLVSLKISSRKLLFEFQRRRRLLFNSSCSSPSFFFLHFFLLSGRYVVLCFFFTKKNIHSFNVFIRNFHSNLHRRQRWRKKKLLLHLVIKWSTFFMQFLWSREKGEKISVETWNIKLLLLRPVERIFNWI